MKCCVCRANDVPNKWDACADCKAPQEPHPCAYSEISGDEETLCTCSRAEEHECAKDI